MRENYTCDNGRKLSAEEIEQIKNEITPIEKVKVTSSLPKLFLQAEMEGRKMRRMETVDK